MSKYYALRISQGMCGDCGKVPFLVGRKRCKDCLEKARLSRKEYGERKYRACKNCIKCGSPALITRFYCEICREVVNKQGATRQRQYRNKRKQLKLCVVCGSSDLVTNRRCEKCRQKTNSTERERRAVHKAACFNGYGGCKCNCCGETEMSFLSIDHVNNDGTKLRKNGEPAGDKLYAYLIRHGFPEGYQVLCMNCQFGRKHNSGVCPHQMKRAFWYLNPPRKAI